MISSPTQSNALVHALAAPSLMAESTPALARATSHCLYKTVTTSKLYVHLITQHQMLHLLVKLYQSVLQKVAVGSHGLSQLMMSQRLKHA
jgi:hypothetical protein